MKRIKREALQGTERKQDKKIESEGKNSKGKKVLMRWNWNLKKVRLKREGKGIGKE